MRDNGHEDPPDRSPLADHDRRIVAVGCVQTGRVRPRSGTPAEGELEVAAASWVVQREPIVAGQSLGPEPNPDAIATGGKRSARQAPA